MTSEEIEFECFLCQEKIDNNDDKIKPLILGTGDIVITHLNCQTIELMKNQVGKTMRPDIIQIGEINE